MLILKSILIFLMFWMTITFYQIQILHESEEPIEEFQIPTFPQRLKQNTLSFNMYVPLQGPFPLHQISVLLDPLPKRPATHKLQSNKRNSQRLGSSFESTHMHMYHYYFVCFCVQITLLSFHSAT